jgi:hypothetical protein
MTVQNGYVVLNGKLIMVQFGKLNGPIQNLEISSLHALLIGQFVSGRNKKVTSSENLSSFVFSSLVVV